MIVGRRDKKNTAIETLLENPPIWSFGVFVKLLSIPSDQAIREIAIKETLIDSIAVFKLNGLRYWLWCPDGETAHANDLKRTIIGLDDIGITNDPSNYSLTIRLLSDDRVTHVLLGQSISVKERFAYRRNDVGASINPVLAAGLVRLIPRNLSGPTIDPTCGSGTLLVERMRYSNCAKGVGIDVSPTAQAAFEENVALAGLKHQCTFRLGSSADDLNWEKCSTVVSNLPFGIRTRVPTKELESLYTDIVRNAVKSIDDGGRILLASSFKRGLEKAASENPDFEVLSKYKALMGGIHYQIHIGKRR